MKQCEYIPLYLSRSPGQLRVMWKYVSFYKQMGAPVAEILREQYIQDCFLQKEARVCVSNAFVLEDSMFK